MNLSKLSFHQAYKLASRANRDRVLEAFSRALKRAWQATGTREYFTVGTARILFPGIAQRWQPVLDLVKDEPKTLDSLLTKLAQSVQPAHTPGAWSLFHTSRASTHSSQGYGAVKYAECFAKVMAAPAEAAGIPVKIERVENDFVVSVETDEEGIAILNNRSVPMRELVRLCWKNGCQPRVFWYWLPTEFEQNNKLDFFGGELK